MKVIDYPKACQSAFREACFTLGEISAEEGLDIVIYTSENPTPLGVKRVYGTGTKTINAAPYVRSLLSPEPLCTAAAGMTEAAGRTAPCFVSFPGGFSDTVRLTAGTEDAPTGKILSAAPAAAEIRRNERDEISLIGGGRSIIPVIMLCDDNTKYPFSGFPSVNSKGMLTFVVDVGAMGELYATKSGKDASEMKSFQVNLASSPDIFLTRSYEVVEIPYTGRRLAWVNRYGAVDYFTFPYSQGSRVKGHRERIYSPEGYRTVATFSEKSETLMSGQVDAATVEWLSEIFSSPAVWVVSGSKCEKVEVAESSAEYSSLRPGTVSVTVSPAKKSLSRKF